MKAGDQVIAGSDAPIKTGNSLPLRNMPIGSTVHFIEMRPGKGAELARRAAASAQFISRAPGYSSIRCPSGGERRSEGRRRGEEWVKWCRSRWSSEHKKKKA